MDTMTETWDELARRDRTIDAIKTYRETNGVNLGEAKSAVERWVAINMPPSPGFQRCCAICDRVAERLDQYSSEAGRAVSYWIEVLPPSAAAVFCQQPIRYANIQTEGNRLDLSVIVVMTGTPPKTRWDTIRDSLEANSRSVWVIDSDVENVTVHHPDTPLEARLLRYAATLDGGDILPGFTCKVADLFE